LENVMFYQSKNQNSVLYRPLNVNNALSYLEQVKIQFFYQSDVHNRFLDIIKKFKSQTIDNIGRNRMRFSIVWWKSFTNTRF
jgi:histone deacetylase complex regulatory component SIN3